MKTPGEFMRTYLKRLVHCYFNLDLMNRQVSEMAKWTIGDKHRAIERGSTFFSLTSYSLSRITLVELSALLDPAADRSLIDWLKKARVHAGTINATRYNPSVRGEREIIRKAEYQAIIAAHYESLSIHSSTVQKIRFHRNKAIAHFDRRYFMNPGRIHLEHSLDKGGVRRLLNTIRDILKVQYGLLFQTDLDMEVHALRTVDAVLEYTLGFIRASEDPILIKNGFEPMNYLSKLS